MEPWKIAVIAALGLGIVGFGMFNNRTTDPGPNNPTGVQATATPGPPAVFAKYMGGTLPPINTVKQWVNTPAPVNLASLTGKPVLLEVFRVECSHCQDAAPFLVQLHKRYAPRGVDFVGIQSPGDYKDPSNPENNWTGVQAWLKQKGYTWPVGFDTNSAWFQGKFGKTITYPSLFLIDRSGKVVFIQSGHDERKAVELAAQLERIAPGKGDVEANANDLASFLAKGMAGGSPEAQKSLATEIATQINAKK